MADAALSHLGVVDCSQGIAGPFCSRLFADLGADVIKVEPPEGDVSRTVGPAPEDQAHPERSDQRRCWGSTTMLFFSIYRVLTRQKISAYRLAQSSTDRGRSLL